MTERNASRWECCVTGQDTLRDECDDSPDCVRNCCVNRIIAPVFFVVFVLMAQFVLVNVVVAVLMKHLEVQFYTLQSVRTRVRLRFTFLPIPMYTVFQKTWCLCRQALVEQLQQFFLTFHDSHDSAARYLRSGKKCYMFYRQFITVSNSERIFKIG